MQGSNTNTNAGPERSRKTRHTERTGDTEVRFPNVIVLCGPPGAGKTRLAVAMLAAARRAGLRIAGRAPLAIVVDAEGGFEGLGRPVEECLGDPETVVLSYDRMRRDGTVARYDPKNPAYGFACALRDRLRNLRERHDGGFVVAVDSLSMLATRAQAEIAAVARNAYTRRHRGESGLDAFVRADRAVRLASYGHLRSLMIDLMNTIAALSPDLVVYVTHPREEVSVTPEGETVMVHRPDLPPSAENFVRRIAGLVMMVRREGRKTVVACAEDGGYTVTDEGERLPVRYAVKDRPGWFLERREMGGGPFLRLFAARAEEFYRGRVQPSSGDVAEGGEGRDVRVG